MPQVGRNSTFEAGNVRFAVQHELWDGNIDDHSDQGVAILVVGQAGGKDTALLRFNCFDLERSYVYGPEGLNRLCRMDPTVDGNPIGWSVKQIRTRLPDMLRRSRYDDVAQAVDAEAVTRSARSRIDSAVTVCERQEHRQAQPRHRDVRGRQLPIRSRAAQ